MQSVRGAGARAVMGKVGKGRGRRCDCRDVDGSTRRDFLTITSVLGLDLAVGGPVLAEPSDERPKEGDVLVAIEGERQTPLEPKDIPAGGPPVLAWPMDLAANAVRSGSRLNKLLLLRLDPSTLVGVTQERAAEGVVAYSATTRLPSATLSGSAAKARGAGPSITAAPSSLKPQKWR